MFFAKFEPLRTSRSGDLTPVTLGTPLNADGFVAMTTTLHYRPMEVRAFASHAVMGSAVSEVKPLTVAVLSTPKTSCRAFCARH